MKKKGKIIKNVNGETPLLGEVIQHIQSFMSGKEAARTTILTKSWHNAWLTRPTIDFDEGNFIFQSCGKKWRELFEEFVKKTMQRYQELNLKIESFSLCLHYGLGRRDLTHDLIVSAMKMVATDLQLKLPYTFTLPQVVLGSETLRRLSASRCEIDGKNTISCCRIRFLTLDSDRITSYLFKDLISSSMEELLLTYCHGLVLSHLNMCELHKLSRLYLYKINVDSMFFASRFPCLKDLTVHECFGCSRLHFATTSLRTVSFMPRIWSDRVKFIVPSIRKFTYSVHGLPSNLSINGASSKGWELDISIDCRNFQGTTWFMNLKKLLTTKFKQSRISLFINLHVTADRITDSDHAVDVEVVPEPIVVENLMIHAPPTFCHALLVRLFMVLRPKCVPHCAWTNNVWMLGTAMPIRDRLIQLLFLSNAQEMFGEFGLKKVNVEINEEFDTEWRPLRSKKLVADSKAMARFQLVWLCCNVIIFLGASLSLSLSLSPPVCYSDCVDVILFSGRFVGNYFDGVLLIHEN